MRLKLHREKRMKLEWKRDWKQLLTFSCLLPIFALILSTYSQETSNLGLLLTELSETCKNCEDTPRSFVFLHIPKCGGTSVRDRIVEAMTNRYALQQLTKAIGSSGQIDHTKDYWINTFQGGAFPVHEVAHTLTQEDRNRIRLLAGHVAYGACNVLEQPCKYISALREPRGRLISEVKWIQKVFAKDRNISNLTVSEFIEGTIMKGSSTERFCTLLDNHETRLLSGDSYKHMFENTEPPKSLITPCLQLTSLHARQAIDNVLGDEMFHAGTLEQLGRFFEELGSKMNGMDFGYNASKHKLNAATAAGENALSPAAETLVQKMTQYDNQVYQVVVDRW